MYPDEEHRRPAYIGNVDLSDYIWRDINIHDRTLMRIDRMVVAMDPEVSVGHGGPGKWSGIQWTFVVKKDGSSAPRDAKNFSTIEDKQWEIALSYRGPFITALSYQGVHRPEDRPDQITMVADKTTAPLLVALVKKLAEDLRLTYLDAHELMALEVPWEELRGNASDRLDYSEMPNAFNLLFYEY